MLWLIKRTCFGSMPVADDADVVENDDGTAFGVLHILIKPSGDEPACCSIRRRDAALERRAQRGDQHEPIGHRHIAT
jgi:hypothetical protein